MKPAEALPLSRPLAVSDVPPSGLDVTVQPTEAERAALAKALGLVAVPALEGRFRIVPRRGGYLVTGVVEGTVTQTCVVSLDPFEAPVREEVEVGFAEEEPAASRSRGRHVDDDDDDGESGHELSAEDLDAPDPVVNGRIDPGALTAEFLALGLDPYPRKPGVSFEPPAGEAEESPFAALKRLKEDKPG
jgi:uncharacterized metal-binding protein YceD (DUF177 family)